jgi:hypothetical protein
MKNLVSGFLFAFFSLSSISFAVVNVQPGAYCQLENKITLQVGSPTIGGYGYYAVNVAGSVFEGAAFDGSDLNPALTDSVRIGYFKGKIFLTFHVHQDSYYEFGIMSLNQVGANQYELTYEHGGSTEYPLSHYVNCAGLTVQ